MTRVEKVTINDLVVVDFPTKIKRLPVALENWKQKSGIPFVKSCARYAWYGNKNNLNNFPDSFDEKSKLRTMRGKEAYVFLLRLISGFESPKLGEKEIRGQFVKKWKEMLGSNPELNGTHGSFVQHIIADSRVVGNLICSGWLNDRYELVARNLSGQRAKAKSPFDKCF